MNNRETNGEKAVPASFLHMTANIMDAIVLALHNPERIPQVQQILRETATELRRFAAGDSNEA